MSSNIYIPNRHIHLLLNCSVLQMTSDLIVIIKDSQGGHTILISINAHHGLGGSGQWILQVRFPCLIFTREGTACWNAHLIRDHNHQTLTVKYRHTILKRGHIKGSRYEYDEIHTHTHKIEDIYLHIHQTIWSIDNRIDPNNTTSLFTLGFINFTKGWSIQLKFPELSFYIFHTTAFFFCGTMDYILLDIDTTVRKGCMGGAVQGC